MLISEHQSLKKMLVQIIKPSICKQLEDKGTILRDRSMGLSKKGPMRQISFLDKVSTLNEKWNVVDMN